MSRSAGRGKGRDGRKPGGEGAARRGAGAGRNGRAPGGRVGRASGDRLPRRAPLDERGLQAVLALSAPADKLLRQFFQQHREMGRRDRASVAETVFDVLRNRRLYAHLSQAGEGALEQRLAAVSRIRRGLPAGWGAGDADSIPAWLMRARDAAAAEFAFPIRYSLPDWLAESLSQGPDADALAAALLEPAPLDLRVNAAKSDRQAAVAALAEDGIDAAPLQIAPLALRVAGKPALETSRAFRDGLVEVQDAGSQLIALLVAPARGQTVVDFCAGAGGKTLALAAAMRSTGQVFACDVSPARLLRLRPRLQRAGVTNVQPLAIDSEHDARLLRLAGRAHAVLVDAPCTGTGTLRRNPDLKWRIEPANLARLVLQQQSILAAAARLVRPGGVLVYATCSLLSDENDRQAERFEAAHPEFVREPAAAVLQAQGADPGPARVADDDQGYLRLLPQRDDVDAFFAVRWRRNIG